ncbi:MAG: translation initiation factor 2 [Sphaerochaeta sp.]|jgi:methylthioribose-1-phosphate isomerase|uniref:translation initiation factor 2 n=1 Tax=Sphaerochaeta sp. TaxID=1972642 RepID=UPI003D0EAB22
MITLPYLLRSENIARIEGKHLLIGDRRVYPFEKRFERCSSIPEVASALKRMVTQGGGPLEVALTAMVFVAEQMKEGSAEKEFRELENAAARLIASRPTNTTMKRTLLSLLDELRGDPGFIERVAPLVEARRKAFDQLYHQLGRAGSSLISDKAGVLTTCFAEHTFLLSLAYAKEEGKEIRVFVPETRPYLQGSRLTAPSLQEMGIEVSVITDGMGATFLGNGDVNLYMTAADLVCMDGTVVNKVGTLGNAIAAKRFQVPYYAFSVSPDPTKQDASGIQMEWRSAGEVTQCMGKATSSDGMKALYPAFDIISPDLVTGVVTGKGVLKPEEIKRNFQ